VSVALLYSCVSGVLASRTRCQQFHGCGGYLPGAGRPLDWMMYSTYPVTFVTLYNFTFAYNKKGFQDIYTSNLAMLARQGWRHVQNKESLCCGGTFKIRSLCCRILGAKAVAKPGMSYSWRSILKGVQVLKKGIIWRVGNGANIKIWKDPSIPKEWTRLPSWPRGMNLQQTVDELVDPGLGTWDEQLVRQTFCQEDAEIILAIPVHTEMDDCVAGHYDKKGDFFRSNRHIRCKWRTIGDQ